MRRLAFGILALAASTVATAAAPPVQPMAPEIPFLPPEFVFPTYEQQVVLTFATEEAARRASVTIAPLFDGYERAVSCRWDDNIWENIQVKEVLDRHGTKATWYTNSNSVHYLEERDYRPVAREILQDGNSIGSHTLSHPYITYQNRNRMFEELAGVRIEWESELDTPVLSHAFSFIDYRNGHDGDRAQADTLRSLQRAGLYHLAVFRNVSDELPSSMIYSVIMPPENQTFDTFRRAVDWAVADEVCAERFPLISHSMHGWYGTPAVEYGFDELDRRVAYLASFENFWQTNQNAYAAYRYQYENTDLKIERTGNTLRLSLQRPRARFLNDSIPFTLSVDGVDASEVLSVSTESTVIQRSERLPEKLLFNIPHADSEQIPTRIGRIENTDNEPSITAEHEDPDFPGLRALMVWNSQPELLINNQGDHAMEDLTLTWRLPLQWQPGVIVEKIEDLPVGESTSRTLPPIERSSDPALVSGSAYLVAQLDFSFDKTPSRLYLTVNLPEPIDASFPRDAFTIMGPFPPSHVNVAQVDGLFAEHGQPLGPISMDGGIHAAPSAARPLARFDIGWLHPEIVPTQADWYLINSPIFVLQTVIESPRPQPFLLQCYPDDVRSVWVNDSKAEDYTGQLREGRNDLAIVYFHEGTMTPSRHSGAFLRLVDPTTLTRLADLRFVTPVTGTEQATGGPR